jgi:hypothetical protein
LCWKTWQLCLLGDWTEYSGRWPRSGMMRNGIAYRLRPLVPRISGTGFSSSERFPTPYGLSANQGQGDGEFGKAIRHWPTPRNCTAMTATFTANAIQKAPERFPNLESVVAQTDPIVGGQLNPTWVEWLMGFPLGWTDCEDLETR